MSKLMKKLIGKGLNLQYKINPDAALNRTVKYFSKVRRRNPSSSFDEFMNTARQSVLQLEDRAIRTYEWGGGENKVLLAHGWESRAARWTELIKVLQENNFSVIALDAPAHGLSQGAYYDQNTYGTAIRTLIEEKHIKYAVGHSLGGFTLLLEEFFNPFPTVEKLVFMGIPVDFIKFQKGFQNSFGLSPSLSKAFEGLMSEKHEYNIAEFSFLEVSEEIEKPHLFVHDKEDRLVSYAPTKKLAEKWKQARLLTTEGLGHGLRDSEVYEGIVEYLKN